jgi:hypothetical protein
MVITMFAKLYHVFVASEIYLMNFLTRASFLCGGYEAEQVRRRDSNNESKPNLHTQSYILIRRKREEKEYFSGWGVKFISLCRRLIPLQDKRSVCVAQVEC